MNVKWGRRLVLSMFCYFTIHLIVNIVDNRRVIDRTEIPTKKESDGPLVMKDLADRKGKVLSLVLQQIFNLIFFSIFLLDAKPLLSRAEDLVMHPPENKTYPLPEIPESFIKKFERFAKVIHLETDEFLLFTMINRAYLNLTLNWLCNVAPFKSNIHAKTLIVSMDRQSCRKITKEWPKVRCVSFDVPEGYNEALNWGRQSYINLLTLRSELMVNLVSLDIPYILFETDSSWLRDPMQYFGNQTIIDDADIIVPKKGYDYKGQKYTFDPMVVYPTNGSRSMLMEMKRRLLDDPKLFDQDVLEDLCGSQYFGVVCRQFEWEEIADGKWFKLADAQRRGMKPYIVNNNYYVGVPNKIGRQALNGLWFLSPKGNCIK
ncbi:unnamed protein product, partial [Anisakis simplex]|uniref:Nucleotid_trans domain-containing protein n=1 Tax=Anisakis simplex TaxID=6269 RepID=A0A0M3J2F7_ANISI